MADPLTEEVLRTLAAESLRVAMSRTSPFSFTKPVRTQGTPGGGSEFWNAYEDATPRDHGGFNYRASWTYVDESVDYEDLFRSTKPVGPAPLPGTHKYMRTHRWVMTTDDGVEVWIPKKSDG